MNPIDPSYNVVPRQKPSTQPQSKDITCRFNNIGAPFEKQNQIGIGYLLSDIRDVYEKFVMLVLTKLLIEGPNSYFYKSLVELNISVGFSQLTGFDPHICDTMFVPGLQDVSVADLERCQKIFDQTSH